MNKSISQSEVQALAADWYRKLDVHAPMVEVLPLLSDEVLEMKFPEATLFGMAEFEGWYQRVIRIFFDEVHTVKEVSLTTEGESVEAHVVVEWKASVWNAPNANSARIMLDADQTWSVKRSSKTGKLVITKYVVNSLDYHPGSAKL
jgi:hypothetical protein